ncbi:MAG: hypothetical protein ABSE06_03530 [Anaerolineaceae bacterium]|jgi:5-methyltetrahydrofolate--homocysteine methyltransferase
MPIDFSPERWQKTRENYIRWWEGELDRPLIPVLVRGRDPGRPRPAAPLLSQETCTDLTWSAEELIDRIDYELARLEFLGDAFPYFNMDCFGPGVGAAFLGARLDNSSGRVWFFPPDQRPIQDMHFEYDPENVWLKRIRDLYRAGMEHWQGQVLMGMTDLGGNLDILSAFRPSEQLLMDLYDTPEEVERLLWEAHAMWWKYYEEFNSILQPVNPGYSDWGAIYSDRPAYMLQSDFSYMIGPKMFQRFALPELQATCQRLGRSFYHLDGVGQIPHLPYLLGIEALDGVQWVPGDGKPDCSNWPEVYRPIRRAGKLTQVINGGFPALHAVRDQLGSLKGVHYRAMVDWEMYTTQDEPYLRHELARFGIE